MYKIFVFFSSIFPSVCFRFSNKNAGEPNQSHNNIKFNIKMDILAIIITVKEHIHIIVDGGGSRVMEWEGWLQVLFYVLEV